MAGGIRYEVMLSSLFPSLVRQALRPLRAARSFADEQRTLVRREVVAARGLMQLLMKARNEGGWTSEDRVRLRACVKRFSVASPFLLVLVMPGGFLFLPLVAWWLDRRRSRDRRAHDAAQRPVP